MQWSKIAIYFVVWRSLVAANSFVEIEDKVEDVATRRKLIVEVSKTGYSGSSGFGSGNPSDSGSSAGSSNPFASSDENTSIPSVKLFGVAGGEFIVYIVLAFFTSIYAFLYKSYVVDVILRENKGPIREFVGEHVEDFDSELCACVTEPCMCIRLICPCTAVVRQAHTMSVVSNATGRQPMCSFWLVFWGYVIGGICCCIPPLCLTMYLRMELKQKMKLPDNILYDFCLSWLCTPCTFGQMAMAVDKELECEVNFCCDLQWDEPAAEEYDTYMK